MLVQSQFGQVALGYQQITNLAAATSLTIPAGTTLALVTPKAQAVRWRDDGTNPTSSVGYPLAVDSELVYDAAQLSALKFIEQVGGAILEVVYYGSR